jgi:hypothetical protein
VAGKHPSMDYDSEKLLQLLQKARAKLLTFPTFEREIKVRNLESRLAARLAYQDRREAKRMAQDARGRAGLPVSTIAERDAARLKRRARAAADESPETSQARWAAVQARDEARAARKRARASQGHRTGSQPAMADLPPLPPIPDSVLPPLPPV